MPKSYVRGLDGMRTLGLLAVMAVHSGWSWAVGGSLGVDIFFVISGYLITSQLLSPDWTFSSFMWRRIARLWPALVVLCLTCSVLALSGTTSLAAPLFAVLYLYTPGMLLDLVGKDNYLLPTWSLAVEMQFYLAWATLLLNLRHRSRVTIARVCLAGALCSQLLMVGLSLTGHVQEAYYLTPSRLGGLLMGAAIAASPNLVPKSKILVVVLAPVVVILFVSVNMSTRLGLTLGSLVAVVFSSALMSVVLHSQTDLITRLLDLRVPRWVGVRSYSLYLWHVPVFVLVAHHTPVNGISSTILQWVAVFVVATASYSLIENPARHYLIHRRQPSGNEPDARGQLNIHAH